ncbi:homocysteine S-methyltransferase family protein [Nocardia bovistercoris]|uniref:Homocysteine S-methyltransferase family protein n=1 Tax=Nocardia bovistercoris TaxID=2785916 RepID=A0A931IGT3_9NOCA|nr:homocysteine S-methyltransferase family protein [Nocardia bovistercoris]MBH0781154.1 homocysteine S-methyltransferase family protein [Nocardia bovistercoris]
MSTARPIAPWPAGQLLLTDGGLETTLVFHEDIELPDFAAFPLLEDEGGRDVLRGYYRDYADIAHTHGLGIVLDTPTWRAPSDWGARLGYDADALVALNAAAVDLLAGIRAEYAPRTHVVISGNVGPRGDGYDVGARMSVDAAEEYHRAQIAALARAGADLITVLTMTHVEEAVGVVRAARAESMPVVVGFTVETDGTLPSGQALSAAIIEVDAATEGYPVHYGINCAHPDHFEPVLRSEPWAARIGLLRANASRSSHAELDEATELDSGDPAELGARYAELRGRFPNLVVLGGCCGTDDRHIAAVAEACAPEARELSPANSASSV